VRPGSIVTGKPIPSHRPTVVCGGDGHGMKTMNGELRPTSECHTGIVRASPSRNCRESQLSAVPAAAFHHHARPRESAEVIDRIALAPC
jgi:hypothetical protein